MKKIFAMVAVATALLFAGNANAQLGIHAGYGTQNYNGTYTIAGTTTHDTTTMSGAFVGVDYNLPISNGLNVNIGLQGRYNFKSDEGTLLGVTTTTKANQMLLDVPILFNYGFNLTEDLKLSALVGPTIAFAINGKTNRKTVTGSTTLTDVTTDWYGDNSKRKKLDVSATVGLCFSYESFRLYGGYNMGLLNLSSDDNRTLKGGNLFVGLGYAL